MASQHTVEQGEFLAKIAAKYGFSEYRIIWDHRQNTNLERQRQNRPCSSPVAEYPSQPWRGRSNGTGRLNVSDPRSLVQLDVPFRMGHHDPIDIDAVLSLE